MLNKKTILLTVALTGLFIAGNCQYTSSIRVEQVLKTDTTSLGQKINYPSFKDDEVTILKLTFPPGQSTGWHKHDFPVFAFVMQGNLTVEFENGKTVLFPENSSFSEVIGISHSGSNRGETDLVLLAIYLGEKGQKLSVPMKSDDRRFLNGTWVPVSQEIGGAPLPKAVFEKQKLVISDSTYVLTAESADKGVVKYGDGKMDIFGKEGVNKGKHFTAIYSYEKGKLTICYNLAGDRYPEAFGTAGRPAYFLCTFINNQSNDGTGN